MRTGFGRGSLAEGAEWKQRGMGRGAVEASSKVSGDCIHGIAHAGTQTDEVGAEDNVVGGGFSFESNSSGEEGNEFLVGVVGKGKAKESGVEAGLCWLIKVERNDGIAVAMGAQIPDGAASVGMEVGYGNDEGFVGWPAGSGAGGGTCGKDRPVQSLPFLHAEPGLEANQIGDAARVKGGVGGGVGRINVRRCAGCDVGRGQEGEPKVATLVRGRRLEKRSGGGFDHGFVLGTNDICPAVQIRVRGGFEGCAQGFIVGGEGLADAGERRGL